MNDQEREEILSVARRGNRFSIFSYDDQWNVSFNISDESANFLFTLWDKYKESPDLIMEKAIILFKTALDARRKGNRLAILSPDDEIVEEIVGIEPRPRESAEAPSGADVSR